MTDYQRACEVVGDVSDSVMVFHTVATDWLLRNGDYLHICRSKHKGKVKYEIECRGLGLWADTLTAALTAAVLAVAGENDA